MNLLYLCYSTSRKQNATITVELEFSWCVTFADCRPQTADCRLQNADGRLQTADCRLQNADGRLQTADCRLHEAARLLILNDYCQKYRNKGGVIINVTLFREVSPRSEVYIFHANYTYLIPKGAVGCSFRIELEQNNVCRCHKLAHESIATVTIG